MTGPHLIHATAIAIGGRAVLLLGRPGAGKSDLALRLIDRGARLIADDQVVLTLAANGLVASAPPSIAGLIEMRGVGLVPVPPLATAPVALLVDLEAVPERLPLPASRELAGRMVPVVALRPFEASAPLKVERALSVAGLAIEACAVASPASPVEARVLLVTGMSGAGKSTALKMLEDLGYEAVDNLPLALLDRLLESPDYAAQRPLAFGIDSRTRGFDADAIVRRLRTLREAGTDVDMLFLDCTGEQLTQRFSETRRRHPLALDRPVTDGIALERELLAPLRRWSDIVIDTTGLETPELRRALADRFSLDRGPKMTISCTSFGFARGLPRDADLVFDMRFLRNPHWEAALRPLTGEDAAVGAYIEGDPAFAPAFDRIAELLLSLLPGYVREGKSYLTVAFGCTGGRHRSVFVANRMAAVLAAAGFDASVAHRDRDRHGDTAWSAGDDDALDPGGAPAVQANRETRGR